MKKKVIVTSIASVLLLFSVGVGAYAATKMTLIVNGNVAKVAPRVIDGTTYIPVRVAGELLGADVKYDSKNKTVTITSDGSTPSSVNTTEEFIFTQLDAKDGDFGWDLTVDITNNSAKKYSGVNFTASFYDANGKRVGSAFGSVLDIAKGATKTANMVTSDDLTGWKTVKFQIDVKV